MIIIWLNMKHQKKKRRKKEGSGSENTSMFTVYKFMSTLIYNII